MRGKCILGLSGLLLMSAAGAAHADTSYDFDITGLTTTVTYSAPGVGKITIDTASGSPMATINGSKTSVPVDSFMFSANFTNTTDGFGDYYYATTDESLSASINGEQYTLADGPTTSSGYSNGLTQFALPGLLLNGNATDPVTQYIDLPYLDASQSTATGGESTEVDIDFTGPSATPLPTSALGGIGLLTGLGALRLVRKNELVSE